MSSDPMARISDDCGDSVRCAVIGSATETTVVGSRSDQRGQSTMSFEAQVTPSCGRLSGQLVEDSRLEAPRVDEGRLDHDALQLILGSALRVDENSTSVAPGRPARISARHLQWPTGNGGRQKRVSIADVDLSVHRDLRRAVHVLPPMGMDSRAIMLSTR